VDHRILIDRLENTDDQQDKNNEQRVVEDTYKLFSKDLIAPAASLDGRSRNKTMVNYYTDDRAIMDDKVFFESFHKHYD